MLGSSRYAEDRPQDLSRAVQQLVRSTRSRGFAERDPNVEPKNSGTIAVPIMAQGHVLATLGLTYFRSAVQRATIIDTLVPALKEARAHIEQSIEALRTP